MELAEIKHRMPPPHLLQRVSNSPSVDDFVRSFPIVRQLVHTYLQRAGLNFASFDNILDLGCGVGRFMFAFADHLGPNQRIYGSEVHEECARWCQQNIDFAATNHSSIEPPLSYVDRQIDLIYALSVFTHLRLDMQFRWAWEIHRVLRPGGVMFATFHGPVYFPFFHGKRAQLVRDEMFSFGDDGLFAYLAFPSSETLHDGQVQVSSAHNEEFFREQFSAFELVARFPQSLLAAGQDLYIIRRPEHGRSIARPMGDDAKWAWVERVAGSEPRAPVELVFQLQGHDRFRVYPAPQIDGVYGMDFHVEIRSKDQILVNEQRRPSNDRILGKTQYHTLDFAIPPQVGEVTVRLSTSLRNRGTLPADAVPEVHWSFPTFV